MISITKIMAKIFIPIFKIAVLKKWLNFGQKKFPQSVHLLGGWGVALLFGRILISANSTTPKKRHSILSFVENFSFQIYAFHVLIGWTKMWTCAFYHFRISGSGIDKIGSNNAISASLHQALIRLGEMMQTRKTFSGHSSGWIVFAKH